MCYKSAIAHMSTLNGEKNSQRIVQRIRIRLSHWDHCLTREVAMKCNCGKFEWNICTLSEWMDVVSQTNFKSALLMIKCTKKCREKVKRQISKTKLKRTFILCIYSSERKKNCPNIQIWHLSCIITFTKTHMISYQK